jgi:hypothetical protein
MGAPSALAAVDGISPPSGTGPSIGEDTKYQQRGSTRPGRPGFITVPGGRYERRLLTKLSAMELPSPPSSGIRIQAHR